ncbi:reverse transcriptase domain-containing protein, partial [Tanacetum coccineum]
MDLCGPMRVASVNGKKYILVIVDDYSRFTWMKFLASKDEYNGTEFVKPKTYKDAPTQSCWIEAMQEELNEFERLEVWELVPRPYKVMTRSCSDNSRICCSHEYDRLLDGCKDGIFNGILREEVYVSQPGGFVEPYNPNHVYRLKKALYGLKKAPRPWCDLLSSFMLSQGFSKGTVDPTLFISRKGKDILLLQIYVDDIIFASTTIELCDKFSKIMYSKFKMSMMGKISFFVGLQISQSPRGIFLNQSKYALESLKKYIMESCDPVDTPMDSAIALIAFVDADHAGCQDKIRITSGSMQLLGDRLVSLLSKRQKSAAISSTEAKYITLSGCCAQVLWMRSQLTDYGLGFNKIPIASGEWSRRALLYQNGISVDGHLHQGSIYGLLYDHAKACAYFAAQPMLSLSISKRLKIERFNARIAFSKPQREETYQVTLEALKLSLCYPALVIIVEVLEIYMHQFWNTITKIKDTDAFSFKLDKKKCQVDIEVFHEILQICPRILNQYFIAPPSKEELVTFIQELSYSGRCISRKTTGLDRLKESRARILWGMYYKKNVDYAALLWEDFMYQADNREISSARKKHMPYPRFTKVIINHFISKDKTISMRNRINLHIIRDDSLLARKYKKVASPPRKLSTVKEAEPVKKTKRFKRPAKKSTTAPTTGVAIRDTPGVFVSKKKAPAKADRSKGIEILSDVALSKAAQLKEATKRSKKDYYISQASGSGDRADFESGVPDEQQHKTSSTDEGTGTKPGVPDVTTYDSESKNESWGDSEDDNDDDIDDDSKDDDDENHSFTLKDYDEEEHDDKYESNDDNENVFEEEDDDLYKDVDMRSLGAEQEQERKSNEKMTDGDQNVSQENFLIMENVPPAVHKVASMMNVESRHEESSTQAPSLFNVPVTAIPETVIIHATTVPPTISMITPLPQLTTPSPAPTTIPTTTLIPILPDFSSLFGFDQRVSTLETELSQLKQADLSAQLLESVKSQLPTMVDNLLNTRIGYATRIALESYTKDLNKKVQEERKLYIDVVEKSSTITESLKNVVLAKSSSQPQSIYEATASLTEFELKKIQIDKLEKTYSLKRSRKYKDKDEDPPAGSDQGLKKKKTSKDAEPPKGSKLKESKTSSSKGTKSEPKSSRKSVQSEEPMFETTDTKMPQDHGGNTKDQPNYEATIMDDWFKKPNKPPTPDRPWNDGKSIDSRPPQKWISNIAKARKPP